MAREHNSCTHMATVGIKGLTSHWDRVWLYLSPLALSNKWHRINWLVCIDSVTHTWYLCRRQSRLRRECRPNSESFSGYERVLPPTFHPCRSHDHQYRDSSDTASTQTQ